MGVLSSVSGAVVKAYKEITNKPKSMGGTAYSAPKPVLTSAKPLTSSAPFVTLGKSILGQGQSMSQSIGKSTAIVTPKKTYSTDVISTAANAGLSNTAAAMAQIDAAPRKNYARTTSEDATLERTYETGIKTADFKNIGQEGMLGTGDALMGLKELWNKYKDEAAILALGGVGAAGTYMGANALANKAEGYFNIDIPFLGGPGGRKFKRRKGIHIYAGEIKAINKVQRKMKRLDKVVNKIGWDLKKKVKVMFGGKRK